MQYTSNNSFDYNKKSSSWSSSSSTPRSSTILPQVVFPRDLILFHNSDQTKLNFDDKLYRNLYGFVVESTDGTKSSLDSKLKEHQQRILILVSSNKVSKVRCCNEKEINEQMPKLFKESVEKIHFYERNEPFYWMTNFYESRFTCDNGIQWPTSEHFFQAQKFSENLQVMKQISQLSTPRAAFDFARDSKNAKLLCNVDRWRTGGNVKAMERALEFKFSQNDELLQQLLLTSPNCQLVEHTTNDNFWGDGGNGGENKLGKLLMQLREKKRNETFIQQEINKIIIEKPSSQEPTTVSTVASENRKETSFTRDETDKMIDYLKQLECYISDSNGKSILEQMQKILNK